MSQWVKYLPCKNKAWDSDSQHPCNCQVDIRLGAIKKNTWYQSPYTQRLSSLMSHSKQLTRLYLNPETTESTNLLFCVFQVFKKINSGEL